MESLGHFQPREQRPGLPRALPSSAGLCLECRDNLERSTVYAQLAPKPKWASRDMVANLTGWSLGAGTELVPPMGASPLPAPRGS